MAFADDVLRSADEAFDRVMTGVDHPLETMPPDLEPADAIRWAGDRVTELLAGVAALPLDRLLGPSGGAEDRSPVGEPVTAHAARGGVAEVRIWVHQIGPVPAATLRFVLTELVGPSGASLTGTTAEFAPAELLVPAPACASTVLRLPIPEAAEVGSHHGLVVAAGVAGAVVPITVVVA